VKDDEIDISEYLRIVRKHFGVAILAFIVVLGAICAYTFLSMPVYESSSLVYISTQDQSSFLLGTSTPKVNSDLETQKVIILSQGVLSPIYAKYGINSFTPTVSTVKNSNIIEISVSANRPDYASSIANEIAKSYVNYTRSTRKQEANDMIKFISDQIFYYGAEIDDLNEKINRYEQINKNLTASEKINYQSLVREVNAKNKIYDYLLSKKEEAGLVANANNANVNIISYAELPLAPTSPNIPLNLALGVILALGAAFGAAYLKHSVKLNVKSK
jgi:uncharacterized protein involved in exopolysaccharide biosynthesis